MRVSPHSRKFVVDVVAETRCVDDGEGNTNTVLFEFYDTHLILKAYKTRGTVRTNVDRLNPDALLYVSCFRAIRLFVGEHVRFTESIDEGCAPSSRSTYETEILAVKQRGLKT